MNNYEIKVTLEKYKKENIPVVIEGMGLGIVEDCGGINALKKFIDGTVNENNTAWFLIDYDINNFNIKYVNKIISNLDEYDVSKF